MILRNVLLVHTKMLKDLMKISANLVPLTAFLVMHFLSMYEGMLPNQFVPTNREYESALNRFIDEINSVAAYERWEGSVHSTCLLNLVPGPGNNGVGVIKFTIVRIMVSLSMTILVYDPADREHYTKE
ncbi:unnamed protein product [Coffea canephora]|uniref:DH200=94 genomic scaffold, scaffold_305 n=1 Tax=Coffea canephora TaxID=49390 RepID=A0A068VDT9_COFCA|nr:unnamed protein product [Coffea canephora]